MEYFSTKDLSIISDSLISAIANCEKALCLVNDFDSKKAIREEMKVLADLNTKVCNLNLCQYGGDSIE